jgi:DNA-3-methyladenine glycosylase II
MTVRIDTPLDLERAVAALLAADPRLHEVIAYGGQPPLRRREGGFVGLAAIIVSQQLSTASAAAIWTRLVQRLDPFGPQPMLRARPPTLRRIGLSAPKIRTLKGLARSVHSGAFDFERLGSASTDEALDMLIALHGVGPWTAQSYLLFCRGDADAWPAGDLALQEAVRIALRLASRPDADDMVKIAQGWRPWRAAAARVLWSYYRAVKGRDAVLTAAAVTRNPGPVAPGPVP